MKNRITLFSILLIIIWAFPVYAQISHGGSPRSFDLKQEIKANATVPVFQMIEVNVDSLRADDAVNDPLKERPWRFGENMYVDIDVKSDGNMIQMPNGDKIYRVSIYSPEAVSINLTFDHYNLPAGAELFVYSSDQQEVLGSFTAQNNQADGIFATALVKGDLITVEYFEPATVAFPGEVHLYRVTHGYRGIKDFTKSFGSSGTCNVNVACPGGVGWENEINSVCMLVSGGSGFCTGSLVNNTANDGTPYILTADHCYSDPTSWVFYFNWQSATCSNPGTSPAYDQVSGSVLKARNAASDFCLVQMNSVPPASYDVFYAGWNRATDASISGTSFGIHHPSADIKKISWTTIALTTTTYLQTPIPGDGSHFRVTSWADGTTTEGGSSGSPLFDSNHRIVGQLHGGYAACGNTTSDWYGRLSVSWTGGGTSATRLSNWLDPMGTAPITLDGYNPNTPAFALDAQVSAIVSPTGSSCGTTSITPSVTLRNAGSTTLIGATIYYQIDGGTPVSQPWTGTLATNISTNITFPTVTSTYGAHTIKAWTSAPNGGTDANVANDTATSTFTLSNGVINTFPWTEGFEGGTIPTCWTEAFVTGALSWQYMAGNGSGNTATAHGGSFDATFYEGAYGTDNITKLITPQIDLSGFSSSTLTFWYVNKLWSPDQDELKVYYKTSLGGTWTLLNTYNTNISVWTQATIPLPNLSSDYYIAFEATENYGYGIAIDDINVTGVAAGTIATGTIAGSPLCAGAAVSVPFTITGSFTAGNVFTAQLSDAGGSFASPVSIGTLTSTTSGTISATIPLGTTAGSAYRIRVVASTPSIIGTANTVDIVITSVPAQPSVITGQIGPCQTTTEYYSVTPVAGVVYTWTTPADWAITAGQGTNSLTVTVGALSGTVQVTPSNSCGNGTPQTITVTSSVLPSQPSAITGDNTPCQNSQTYLVTTVPGVTYTWAFPAGWLITAGQGTSSVTVTPSATAGTATVTPSTGCGNGTAQTLGVTPEPIVAQPSVITGVASPCDGTSQIYSVINEASVTYTWAFPAGWVITAGQNTNSVTVTASSTAGNVTVTPSNTCGNGTPQTLALTPSVVPAQPVVTGPAAPCQGTSVSYSVTAVAGETYNWSVPGDWTITAGQGTSSITVTTGTQTGNASVIPSNSCGVGTAGGLSVIVSTIPAQPTAISGAVNPCIGASQVYSVTNVAGVTYTWGFPTGWSQTAGGNTSSVTTTVGSQTGNITVTPSNACGTGTVQTLAVTTAALPVVDLGPDQTICNDESTILDAGAGFSSYSWTGGAATQTFTADGSVLGVGNHTITATVTNSFTCTGSNDIVITVEDCSGIETSELLIGNVYPNPASESINIAFASEYNNLVINLYDATGRLVSSQSVKNTTAGNILTIPVTQMSAGVYSLQIVSELGLQISSVVIQ
ncbi:MAG: hypothetical protein A2W93_01335 [Bacteroidetes bacterium GWF2_43_63]|nr:MAG: hypothetical protein A2W94_10735 [Bacteroidetes bacterium GWE2_42_42]OFY55719.1 MAG: hypothetical protein A2W93_01335 [Bacteroidetes bacterium GWF2_43_63]